MKVAQKQAALTDCPHVTDDAQNALDGESAPPMKLVTIGAGDAALEIGQETVLFRHEDTFHHACGIAVMLDSSIDDDAVGAKIEHYKKLQFDRVGIMVGINLVAVCGEGDRLAEVAKRVSDETGLALILKGESADALAPAAAALKDQKPLLACACGENVDAMVALAKESGCPLVVAGADAAELAELTPKAVKGGVEDLVIATSAATHQDILEHQTVIRRAALVKKERSLGYPTLQVIDEECSMKATMLGTTAISKYASIVVSKDDSLPTILALVTARLNIYTDPQKPIQIDAKLYEVGEPGEDSPVLITTNFSLTYFTVEGDVSSSKVPAWVVVVDTEGTSVLTAWASEKFSAETIAAAIKSSGVEEKVSHKKVMLPGGVAVLSGKLEDESGWSVEVGPRESSGLSTVLRNWTAN